MRFKRRTRCDADVLILSSKIGYNFRHFTRTNNSLIERVIKQFSKQKHMTAPSFSSSASTEKQANTLLSQFVKRVPSERHTISFRKRGFFSIKMFKLILEFDKEKQMIRNDGCRHRLPATIIIIIIIISETISEFLCVTC